MNGGKFDGGQLSSSEKELRDFYKRLLNFTLKSSALTGAFQEIHGLNRYTTEGYYPEVYSYVRWTDAEKLIVVSNFSAVHTSHFELKIPEDIILKWHLKDGKYTIIDQLYQNSTLTLEVVHGQGKVQIAIQPLESFIYQLK
jgi:hypothetical protein